MKTFERFCVKLLLSMLTPFLFKWSLILFRRIALIFLQWSLRKKKFCYTFLSNDGCLASLFIYFKFICSHCNWWDTNIRFFRFQSRDVLFKFTRNKKVINSLKFHSEAYSEPTITSKVVLFIKKVSRFQSLTIFTKSSILEAWLDSECTSVVFTSTIFVLLFYSLKSLKICEAKLSEKDKTPFLIHACPL